MGGVLAWAPSAFERIIVRTATPPLAVARRPRASRTAATCGRRILRRWVVGSDVNDACKIAERSTRAVGELYRKPMARPNATDQLPAGWEAAHELARAMLADV